jgi:hypothetical protein
MQTVIIPPATSGKRGFSTGSRGPFVPENKPVQKIRDKRSPVFGTGSLQTGIKGASTLAPRGVQARDLWYRFVTRTGTKGPDEFLV